MGKKTVTDADEIINRHQDAMMQELKEAGLEPKAVLAFVLGEGEKVELFDFNIAIIITDPPPFERARKTEDAQSRELMAFVCVALTRQLRSS